MNCLDKPLTFVDVETTGSVQNGRITEVACIRVEAGKVVDTFVQLLDPEQFIPYHIQELTGIVNEMVAGKPKFADVADRIKQITAGSVFVAHNVWFDFNFICYSMHRTGTTFRRDVLCTVQLSRNLFPNQDSHSLDGVMQAHNINNQSRHRAFGDAMVLYKFFATLEQKMEADCLQQVCQNIMVTP